MLNVFFGSLENEVYNPAAYFVHQYEDEWIVNDLTREMVLDVDRSVVTGPRSIDSPVLGGITPRELSGGVKTLILMAFDESGYVFNASACGDNCARWILRIAEKKDLTICLHHIMRFGKDPFEIRILNGGEVVHNQMEVLDAAMMYLT